MVTEMKQRNIGNINLDKYHGNETEYTLTGFDIYLKMRVRLDKEARYGVNMCWLCIQSGRTPPYGTRRTSRRSAKR